MISYAVVRGRDEVKNVLAEGAGLVVVDEPGAKLIYVYIPLKSALVPKLDNLGAGLPDEKFFKYIYNANLSATIARLENLIPDLQRLELSKPQAVVAG